MNNMKPTYTGGYSVNEGTNSGINFTDTNKNRLKYKLIALVENFVRAGNEGAWQIRDEAGIIEEGIIKG